MFMTNENEGCLMATEGLTPHWSWDVAKRFHWSFLLIPWVLHS
jgi:hypothetical protein